MSGLFYKSTNSTWGFHFHDPFTSHRLTSKYHHIETRVSIHEYGSGDRNIQTIAVSNAHQSVLCWVELAGPSSILSPSVTACVLSWEGYNPGGSLKLRQMPKELEAGLGGSSLCLHSPPLVSHGSTSPHMIRCCSSKVLMGLCSWGVT